MGVQVDLRWWPSTRPGVRPTGSWSGSEWKPRFSPSRSTSQKWWLEGLRAASFVVQVLCNTSLPKDRNLHISGILGHFLTYLWQICDLPKFWLDRWEKEFSPIFALQEHLSKVVVGRATGCELRCPGINTSLHQSSVLWHSIFFDIFMASLPFAEILLR